MPPKKQQMQMVVYKPPPQTNAKKPKKKKSNAPKPAGGGADAAFRGHMHMLMDPCAAPISRSVYAGASGIITRHSTTAALNTAGADSCLSMIWYPSTFSGYAVSTPGGGTTFTVTPNTGGVPGYNFLTGVAAQARVVGACVKIHWNGTELNRGGTIAFGAMQAGNISRGASAMTTDQLITLCPNKVRVQPGDVEIRWNPAVEEEGYALPGSSIDSFDDRTAIVFAYNGPANAQFNYTYTVLYEWQPKQNQGQPAPPTVRASLPAAVPHINNALARIEGWGTGATELASQAASAVSAVYSGASGAFKLVKGVSKMVSSVGVPMLL